MTFLRRHPAAIGLTLWIGVMLSNAAHVYHLSWWLVLLPVWLPTGALALLAVGSWIGCAILGAAILVQHAWRGLRFPRR